MVKRRRPDHEGYLKYRYEVPGVATIGSEVPLPELQWFLTPFITRGPFDVEIRVGHVGRMRGHVHFLADDADERTYEEHLGSLGANFRIEMGDTIHVTAGPLLEHHRLPWTSARMPSVRHGTPSTTSSANCSSPETRPPVPTLQAQRLPPLTT